MFKKAIAWHLVFAVLVLSIVPRAEGAFSPSESIALNGEQRAVDLEKIQAFLETKLVSQKLQDLGFSPVEIKQRLSQMSDQQLHDYAQKIDDIRAGGDGVGIVIGVLVIIILVWFIMYLMGHRVAVTH